MKKHEDNIEIEEDVEVEGLWQVENRGRGFHKKTENVKKIEEKVIENNKEKEKKDIICRHFKEARCHHGLSGRQSYNGVVRCPFKHPSVCPKLLRHGDRGKAGCRGREAGCNDYHQVKMCYSSMNTRLCSNLKDCNNGYHVKGTVATCKEGKKEFSKEQSKEQEKEKVQEKVRDKEDNVASFLGQLLLQQQEMKKQQDQQWMQQQQMMQLFMTKMGGMDSRPASPMQGIMVPTMANIVAGFRPVA